MLCPGCGRHEGILLYEDSIECDCGSMIVLSYYTCGKCSFVWRLNNGKIIDGGLIDDTSLTMAVESIASAMFGHEDEKECMLLSDILHRCVRCDALATETDKNKFMCVSCGFEWEVEDCVG